MTKTKLDFRGESAFNLRGVRANRSRRRPEVRSAPVSKISPNFNKTNSILLAVCNETDGVKNHLPDDPLVRNPIKNANTNHPRPRLLFLLLALKLVALVHQIQCSTAATSESATRVVAAADDLDLLAQGNLEEPELVPVGRNGKHERNTAAAAAENVATLQVDGNQNLIEFLETLPISSVGQKRTAQFECDLLNEKTNDSSTPRSPPSESSSLKKIVWLKLVRPATQDTPNGTRGGVSLPANDITPLSLDKRIITPDKRFKVRHQPPLRWTLSLENVSLADDKAYFVCQVSGGGGGGGINNQNFVGGGRLNVLMPPKIVDSDTSPNLVLADEFGPLKLQCKVISEQQSQISWRREDGRSLDGLELRFRHQLERRPHQLLSIDSSELLISSVRREQAGAYLCIASNGVQPGVSQRISVVVENCRDIEAPEGKGEPCRDDEPTGVEEKVDGEPTQTPPPAETTLATSTTTTASATTRAPTQQQHQNRSTKRIWTTTSVRSNANASTLLATRRQQTGDKSSRTMRYNNNGNRQEAASKRITTPPAPRQGESDNESNGSRGSSLSFGMGANQISAIWPVLVCALICAARSIARRPVSIDCRALHFAHTF